MLDSSTVQCFKNILNFHQRTHLLSNGKIGEVIIVFNTSWKKNVLVMKYLDDRGASVAH